MRVVISGAGVLAPSPAVEDGIAGAVHVVPGFDPESELGARSSRYVHRSAQLAMVACGRALDDAGIPEEARERVGITVGTTSGSVTGVVDFGSGSFAQKRAYLVAAAQTPNVVLNVAAAASAIKFGLRGPNTTIAAGAVAGLAALRHAVIALRAGHADAIVAGAAEEVSGPSTRVAAATRGGPHSEGAAMFLLEPATAARTPRAEIAAITVASPADCTSETVADALRQALHTAGLADPVRVVAHRGGAEVAAGVAEVLPDVVRIEEPAGDCHSAHAALQIAAVLADGRLPAVIVATDPEGTLGVAVLTAPEEKK
ncbi:beta-ketoacyl synthase N-terminal-like domain-containing protein [Streptosporangium saharense]|uniref:beta-ketoacyl synthase N-terminal-like domain-containing protein n=1 Tax=Streptosporangium saharense TaxID=1706840 RepID=UPI0033185D2C